MVLAAKDLGLKSVLVGNDFSEASRKPLRHAVSIARHFRAKLYLAHVVSSVGLTIAGPEALELATDAAGRDVGKLERDLVESGALADVSHEFIVRQGEVWEELQAIIREKQVEMVVIGTHGRQGIDKMVLGSTAEQIFREADNLVLTVGPHSRLDAPLEPTGAVQSLLFPTVCGEACFASCGTGHADSRRLSLVNGTERSRADEGGCAGENSQKASRIRFQGCATVRAAGIPGGVREA